MYVRSFVCSAVLAGASAHAGLRVVASVPGADIDVPSTGATAFVTFSGVAEPIAGFGITGRFVAPVADQGGGTYPWSTDFGVGVLPPAGPPRTSPSPWFGDVTIAGYPVADAFGGFGGVAGSGDWQVDFDSGTVPPYVAGLRDVAYHLLADGPDIAFGYTETTQQGNSWNRPYFIGGVSGLGPVDYHVLEFSVDTSGLYAFESQLTSGNDHWTCLYKDAFDPSASLLNLHEYSLGNGFSPFDVPRGESNFDQLLFEGVTYFWVTSQWSAFAAFSEFSNTITGPGQIVVAASGCNAADLAEPFGVLDLADLQAFVAAFVSGDLSADLAEPSGVLDLADVQAFVAAFLAGCP